MKLVLIILSFCFFFFSCSEEKNTKIGTIENSIAEKVIATCTNKASCVISLKEFTRFDWDKFYVFNYTYPAKFINNAIGMTYQYYQSDTRPWIFMKNDTVVYYENNPYLTEKPINNKVHFAFPDSLQFKLYTPKDSLFKVEIKSIEADIHIIVLHQL